MSEKTRMQMIQEMLVNEPNDSFLNYGLALEYVSIGKHEEAAAQLKKLVETINPNYSVAYFQLGQALDRLNRIDEAKAALTKGIAVAEKQGDWHTAGEMKELLGSLD